MGLGIPRSSYAIARLLWEYDMWSGEKFKEIPENANTAGYKIDPIKIIEAKDNWLTNIKSSIRHYNFIPREPNPISILFRWGQLQNDYSDVKEYVEDVINNQSQLIDFLERFENRGLDGVENFFKDIAKTVRLIENIPGPLSSSANKVKDYVSNLFDQTITIKRYTFQ